MRFQASYICLLLATVTLFGFNVSAVDGPGGTGGGNEMALEFRASLTEGIAELQTQFPESYNTLMSHGINNAINRATILIVTNSLLVSAHGVTQDSAATNTPDLNLIVVNADRWGGLKDKNLRRALAVHEFASLIHLEHTGFYPISGKLVSEGVGASETMISIVGDSDRVDNAANDSQLTMLCGLKIDPSLIFSINPVKDSIDVQTFFKNLKYDPRLQESRYCKLGKMSVIVAVINGHASATIFETR